MSVFSSIPLAAGVTLAVDPVDVPPEPILDLGTRFTSERLMKPRVRIFISIMVVAALALNMAAPGASYIDGPYSTVLVKMHPCSQFGQLCCFWVFAIYWAAVSNRFLFLSCVYSFDFMCIFGASLLGEIIDLSERFRLASMASELTPMWVVSDVAWSTFLLLPAITIAGTMDATTFSRCFRCAVLCVAVVGWTNVVLSVMFLSEAWSKDEVCLGNECNSPKSVYVECLFVVLIFLSRQLVEVLMGWDIVIFRPVYSFVEVGAEPPPRISCMN